VPKFIQTEDPGHNDDTVAEDTVRCPCTFTEHTSTCGESYEMSLIDSSSQCSSWDDETGGVVGYGFSSFYIKSNFPIISIDVPNINYTEDRTDAEQVTIISKMKNEIECHAAVTIQVEKDVRNSQIASRIVQNARRRFKEELSASLIILNAWRTWLKGKKFREEVNAAQVVQDAWRSWISEEKERRRIVVAPSKAELACCENIIHAIGVVVIFHLGACILHEITQ